jgi:hypothetical protein
MECLANCQEFPMSDPSSELVEISKLNGDLKRNYGRLIGAYLYLRSVSAARRTLRCLGRPSVHAHFCKRDLAEEAWLTLIVSGTRGCEFWADDVAFATQARHLRVPYYASIGVMRRRILR